jgi:HPt (histidine-containing phosphotransfer) domain-containing protein
MTTPAAASPSMTDALNRMWVRFLPEIENRLAAMEGAADALADSGLPPNQREAACRAGHQAAHKLAGILGTFGLPRGTDLARQAEHLLAEEVPAGAIQELAIWVRELRSLVDSRKS